jgi:hypothetical protein
LIRELRSAKAVVGCVIECKEGKVCDQGDTNTSLSPSGPRRRLFGSSIGRVGTKRHGLR